MGKTETNEPLRLDDYESDILRAARTICGSRADSRGADVDDYRNEMRLAAWRAMERNASRVYVLKAVWNAGRSLRRRSLFEAALRQKLVVLDQAYCPRPDVMVDVQKVWVQTPEPDRALVLAHLRDGEPFRRIGERRGVSDWTVRQQFHQALEPVLAVL